MDYDGLNCTELYCITLNCIALFCTAFIIIRMSIVYYYCY